MVVVVAVMMVEMMTVVMAVTPYSYQEDGGVWGVEEKPRARSSEYLIHLNKAWYPLSFPICKIGTIISFISCKGILKY